MNTKFLVVIIIITFIACSKSNTKNVKENSTKVEMDTCEDPDANLSCYFLNMPDELTDVIRIADENEKGQGIIIKGKLLKANGVTPFSDVILYAYHTDNNGYYSKKGNERGVQKWHGHLHGWGKTNGNGEYEIRTIRPARYPGNTAPAHIHWAFKTPEGRMNYLNDFVFSDDSLVDENYLKELREPGDNGVLTLKDNGSGVMEATRITVLK